LASRSQRDIDSRVMPTLARPAVHCFSADRAGRRGEGEVRNDFLIGTTQ
jgi:hypothetical protein